MKERKFARQCTCCKKGMNDGYVMDGGEAYFCSDECLEKNHSRIDIENMNLGGDDSDNYWTEWVCNEDMEWMQLDGELVYIGEQ